jgi:osmotically inducible protein OsmC
MQIKKTASTIWNGGLKDGRGAISTESGQLKSVPFDFNTRFEGVKGSNPEELIGAALSACFSMALSAELGKQNITADSIEAKAEVLLEKTDSGFNIPSIHLAVNAIAPGIDQAAFITAAETTKKNCPVSKVLKANITLEAHLKNS